MADSENTIVGFFMVGILLVGIVMVGILMVGILMVEILMAESVGESRKDPISLAFNAGRSETMQDIGGSSHA